MIENLLIPIHAFLMHLLISLSVNAAVYNNFDFNQISNNNNNNNKFLFTHS